MWKKRVRQREVSFDRIEDLKKEIKLDWKEVAELLGVSSAQLGRYRATYTLPATRYYAARDALLIACEDEARVKREQIMKLFNIID